MMILPGQTRKAMAESAPRIGAQDPGGGEMFINPGWQGTLHVQARCMNSLAEVPCPQNFFHIVSRPYATLAQVLHGVKKPHQAA